MQPDRPGGRTAATTYYQRYDNLHTYPSTEDDLNQIVDIVSFMCETHINIDGRYDKHRGLEDNSQARPSNFNYINHAYSQRDNYFQYHTVDYSKIVASEWPMTVAWSKQKTKGEITDMYTNVTLANTWDLDGDDGPIQALRVLNEKLYGFQNSAISTIDYNEKAIISTENGVPLEIANSAKVTGKTNITKTIGCSNKWSIAQGQGGLYFMDDNTREIYLLSGDGKLTAIATAGGFHSWAVANADPVHGWTPENMKSIRSVYDTKNSEVMFINQEEALSFSEQMQAFTSFYDYNGIFGLDTVGAHNVMTRTSADGSSTKLYEHNAGRYNYFFDAYRPFYTELICHSDGTQNDSFMADKTWTNVSFQFDTFDDSKATQSERYQESEHFDMVECWTEYQEGATAWRKSYPGIGKKFRMWHADLPRDGYTIYEDQGQNDRLRNPWLKLRLTKNQHINKNYRSVLHSVEIGYLE